MNQGDAPPLADEQRFVGEVMAKAVPPWDHALVDVKVRFLKGDVQTGRAVLIRGKSKSTQVSVVGLVHVVWEHDGSWEPIFMVEITGIDAAEVGPGDLLVQ